MILKPTYWNGVDSELCETNLDRPMSPISFLFWIQPTIRATPEQIEAAKMRPLTTGKDLYGMRGVTAKSHANLLEPRA